MTEKERFILTVQHKIPDRVPHFELGFFLGEEAWGETYISNEDYIKAKSQKEKDIIIHRNLELHMKICEEFGWCACPIYVLYSENAHFESLSLARNQYFKDKIITAAFNWIGTFGIPDGSDMLEFSYSFFDKPEEMKEKAEKMCYESVELGKKQIDAGAELIIINTDYAFNTGPFLSPAMFGEFVTPYLERIVRSFKKEGAYVILHSDGNIMPILDQLAEVGLDGLQSIDPQAGMDIALVKKLYGYKLTLMGNVMCSMLQTGTEEEIRKGVRYAVENGRQGGGYIFSSSNCIFKGMPLNNYRIMLDEYRKVG